MTISRRSSRPNLGVNWLLHYSSITIVSISAHCIPGPRSPAVGLTRRQLRHSLKLCFSDLRLLPRTRHNGCRLINSSLWMLFLFHHSSSTIGLAGAAFSGVLFPKVMVRQKQAFQQKAKWLHWPVASSVSCGCEKITARHIHVFMRLRLVLVLGICEWRKEE